MSCVKIDTQERILYLKNLYAKHVLMMWVELCVGDLHVFLLDVGHFLDNQRREGVLAYMKLHLHVS
jgi:hypothetical protein